MRVEVVEFQPAQIHRSAQADASLRTDKLMWAQPLTDPTSTLGELGLHV